MVLTPDYDVSWVSLLEEVLNLGVPPDKLDEVAGERVVWPSLFRLSD